MLCLALIWQAWEKQNTLTPLPICLQYQYRRQEIGSIISVSETAPPATNVEELCGGS